MSLLKGSGTLRENDPLRDVPLRILSLDGGGIRGYSTLILIHNFMYKLHVSSKGIPPGDEDEERDEIDLRPCEYFDIIGGTGTGGLIAIMLGRLRMTTTQCINTYEIMTQKVFQTDKTIAGIPYKSTLFKASKLEEAIKECVRNYENQEALEGSMIMNRTPLSPRRADSIYSTQMGLPRRSTSSSFRAQPGNPNALLYNRGSKPKTVVTAVLEGGTPVMLRSYRARREHSVARDCTVWQAGRATCATGLAFKPVTIGRWTFTDKGNGKFNPSLQILDEAESEGRGRPVGAFLSIGTGKLPHDLNRTNHEWYEGIAGGIDRFAEARRRLLSKIEACEATHQDFLKVFKERGIPDENYLRLNPDNGVGEFGMNEWSRLRQINNMTEAYARKVEVDMQRLADQMAVIGEQEAEVLAQQPGTRSSYEQSVVPPIDCSRTDSRPSTMASSNAVELPTMDLPAIPSGRFSSYGPQYPMYPFHETTTPQDKFTIVASDETTPLPPPSYPTKTNNNNDIKKVRVPSNERPPRTSSELPPNPGDLASIQPPPPPPRRSLEQQQPQYQNPPPLSSSQQQDPVSSKPLPPPLPPKTPIQQSQPSQQPQISPAHAQGPRARTDDRANLPSATIRQQQQQQQQYPPQRHGTPLPYPEDDGPPPVVNMARKPVILPR